MGLKFLNPSFNTRKITYLSQPGVWYLSTALKYAPWSNHSHTVQQVLDYRDLRNTGIDKKFQVIWLSGLFTNKSQ